MTRSRRILLSAISATVLLLTAVAPAAAGIEITGMGGEASIKGQFSRGAGNHADLVTEFSVATQLIPPYNQLGPKEDIRDVKVDLPLGLVGNPTAAPVCTAPQLVAGENGKYPICPIESQIGVAHIETNGGVQQFSVFNMERPSHLPALFALNFAGVVVKFEAMSRADGGITVRIPSISQAQAIIRLGLTVWAVPADPIHDAMRYDPQKFGAGIPGFGASSKSIPVPFMTNPTNCDGVPAVTRGELNSWQNPGYWDKASFSSDYEGIPFVWKDCGRVPFRPTMTAESGTHRAASPTGLDVQLEVPQVQDPYGIATGHVKRTVVTLPEGMSMSPSAVAGLGACSLTQIKLGSMAPAECPDSAKIGNVEVKTPLLEDTVEGEVVLAAQKDNPFGSTFAIYLILKGPGVYLKIPGELNVGEQNGRVRAIFDDLPQLPFDEVHLDFRGGPTAPLVTPSTCGVYTTRTEISSYARPNEPVVAEAPMLIDENCAGKGGFSPNLQAGVANPVAGAYSPLTIRVRRQDGEQNVSRLEITLPEGELAKLKGVTVCPEALAPAGACPRGSQVGISTTAIGTGAFPLFVPQPGKEPTALYLAGPYKGTPYSLITMVPAQSGPFDFGDIVVRTAIDLNPVTAQVIAKSDPLPQMLEGVPIAYRDVRIEVQKPDFTVNPTSCEQRFITSRIISTAGAVAQPWVPAKVGDCASLEFGPKLSFRLQGGTNRGDFQALTATLKTGRREANLSRVSVTLPRAQFLEQAHIGTVCTRVQFAAKNCPDASIYGKARAVTPLLDKPLEGPVYLRSSDNLLPDMVADLRGQFDVELAGRIDSENGGIRTTFARVPDAPVSKFVLTMKGGRKSLLVNSRNLCKSRSRAIVRMLGQNGMRHVERPVVQNNCGEKAKQKPGGSRR
ncbi:MAG TPA: hypothetical protein VJU14_01230 [Solirubrobacterales bacterium]|nr:hypothetical protein [Solirubrobacterales bacterium]